MRTILIKLTIGSPVLEIGTNRKGTIKDITLVPNGINDSKLVTILIVEFEDGRRLSATSDKFSPVPDYNYEEHYPSVHLLNLK